MPSRSKFPPAVQNATEIKISPLPDCLLDNRRDFALPSAGHKAHGVSALDPIATQKIEELVLDLRWEYTIVIVTRNRQQAARISDYTAFFWLGKLIEFDETERTFTSPENSMTEDYITGRFG